MEKVNFIITQDDKGKRLDVYLADKLKQTFSRSQVKRFIDNGGVLVDSKPKKPSYILCGNENIEVAAITPSEPKIELEDIPLEIIYEDDDIIVINKPVGMVVHPAIGNPNHTLVNALLFHTKGKLSHLDTIRPGIVHRLDKEVSGLIVAAKNDYCHKILTDSFKTREIKRKYIAFVKGQFTQDEGDIEAPIGRSERDRKKMAVKFSRSKAALTHFTVIKRYLAYTKLQINLLTGRTHQIRVHMSHIGHPIIGDVKYGGQKADRIALYAAGLTLKHPRTQKELHFKIGLPDELKALEI